MSRPEEILEEAVADLPDGEAVNEIIYRQIVPELNRDEREELALMLIAAVRELYSGVQPEILLSTVVFGIKVGRAIERLHQAGRL